METLLFLLKLLVIVSPVVAGVFLFAWVAAHREARKAKASVDDLRSQILARIRERNVAVDEANGLRAVRDSWGSLEANHRRLGEITRDQEAARKALAQLRDEHQVTGTLVEVRSEIAERQRHLTALDQEIVDRRKEIDRQIAAVAEVLRLGHDIPSLRAEEHRAQAEAARLLPAPEVIEAGFVLREFAFDDPEGYKDAIKACQGAQALALKEKRAAACAQTWTLGGDAKAGQALVEGLIKLALRCFNGEADLAIATVKWNNRAAMEERIRKSEAAIEKILAKWGITIRDTYRDLKIEELRLTWELEQMRFHLREEQKEIREQQREEARAIREAEQAQRDAERQERAIAEALRKAKAEADAQAEATSQVTLARIADLEAKLIEAQEAGKRAISMAQLTRQGHVYIISNVGSFGEDVYKIGMTRRQVPQDRVDELSDASVPFDFDVHAMIKTDDAPALESALHNVFATKRMNLVNDRKEFFKVSIDEIQAAVRDRGLEATLTLAAEAREFRQSVAMRRQGVFGIRDVAGMDASPRERKPADG
jgi:hypothetical protein